jgi:hypothetical protein
MEQELLQLMTDFVNRVDTLNRRLVIALLIAVCVLAVCFSTVIAFNEHKHEQEITAVVHDYFYADYDYGTITQTQNQTVGDNNDNNG